MADMNVDEVEFKGYLFRASDFLGGPNVQSNQLDPRYEEFLKKQGVIPVSTQIFIPTDPVVYVDWTCTGWFSIFEIAFRTGFSLPCSKLMCDVIKALGVMPFQLMPSVWKLISAIDSLCIKHHLEIALQDLMNCYLVRTVGKGRVSFRALSADEALITNLDSGDDKNWACRFLFINKASLGEGFEYLPDQLAAKPTDWVAKIDDASLARLTAFRNLGVKERTWPKALCRTPLPQFDFAKFQTKPVVLIPGEAKMVEAERSESGNQDVGSVGVVMQEASSSACGNRVSARTRGKGKLGNIAEELQALRKRVKVEATGSKDAPIEIPAPLEQIDPMVESPVSIPVPTAHSPETVRIRKALKSLSLYRAERDFCEGSSDRSEEIAESMFELAEPGALDMDYDSLVKRSIFASFQALHFSSAAARARQGMEMEGSNLKAALTKATEDLDHERVAHTESLLELERTKAELRMAKDSLGSLDKEMTKLLEKINEGGSEENKVIRR